MTRGMTTSRQGSYPFIGIHTDILSMQPITVLPVEGLPLIQAGDNLEKMITDTIPLQDGDILVIASTVYSKARGYTRDLSTIEPGQDAIRLAARNGEEPRFVQAVLDATEELILEEPFILSAMEQQVLEKTVTDNDIHHFFEDLCGLSDNFAVSKVANGKSLINKRGLNPERTLMVGDTIHDYEVAQAIGCKCVLIAKGHQSKERLLTTGAHVLDGLDEIEFL